MILKFICLKHRNAVWTMVNVALLNELQGELQPFNHLNVMTLTALQAIVLRMK
jgi:hypothetical protein